MKILIVVDMQRDFVDGALGTEEAVSILSRVVEKIKAHQGPVIVTYDTHGEDYMTTAEGSRLPVPHCIKGTPGWALDPAVEAVLNGKTVTKVEKPTFGSVKLPETVSMLANGNAFSLELVGLCTDICVVSNALLLKANFPEAPIRVDASCCAGVTTATHDAALATMKMCQIDVI